MAQFSSSFQRKLIGARVSFLREWADPHYSLLLELDIASAAIVAFEYDVASLASHVCQMSML